MGSIIRLILALETRLFLRSGGPLLWLCAAVLFVPLSYASPDAAFLAAAACAVVPMATHLSDPFGTDIDYRTAMAPFPIAPRTALLARMIFAIAAASVLFVLGTLFFSWWTARPLAVHACIRATTLFLAMLATLVPSGFTLAPGLQSGNRIGTVDTFMKTVLTLAAAALAFSVLAVCEWFIGSFWPPAAMAFILFGLWCLFLFPSVAGEFLVRSFLEVDNDIA